MEESEEKPVSLLMALTPFIAMILLVIGGKVFYGLPLQFTLLLSALVAGIFASRRGLKVSEMIDGIGKTLRKAMPAVLILIAIGAIVGTWMFSGTVPYLIYYGLKLIHPDYLPVTAFLVTAILSTFTGTSWGSAATAGVAFMGIGLSMGVPGALIAGAVVSGAVFGDKVSPVSDTTNICAMASEVSVYDHIRGMLPNVAIAGILAAIAFLVFGFMNSGSNWETTEAAAISSQLDTLFVMNPIVLLPAAVVFIGGYKGYPPLVLMLSSSLIAIVIGVLLNGFDFTVGAQAMVSGYAKEMIPGGFEGVSEVIILLLERGGMEGMMSGAVLYCVLAIAFGSIMAQAGFIDRLMQEIFKLIKSAYGLVVAAFVSGGVLNGVSGNAMFSILMIGQLFRGGFRERNLPLPLLSRTMENSMTLMESLIPWHVTALFMAATLGVDTWEYMPYAFFNIFGIVLFFGLSRNTVNKAAISHDSGNNIRQA